MASRLTEAQKTLKTLAAGAKKREEFFLFGFAVTH